jgi:hypothetical protein
MSLLASTPLAPHVPRDHRPACLRRLVHAPRTVARSRPRGFALAVTCLATMAISQDCLHRIISTRRPRHVALKTCVANICYTCFRCFIVMFQVFRMDVAKVDPNVAHVVMAIHVCCKSLLKMFHLFQTYVASVITACCICCKCMFHLFSEYVAIISSECCKK